MGLSEACPPTSGAFIHPSARGQSSPFPQQLCVTPSPGQALGGPREPGVHLGTDGRTQEAVEHGLGAGVPRPLGAGVASRWEGTQASWDRVGTGAVDG